MRCGGGVKPRSVAFKLNSLTLYNCLKLSSISYLFHLENQLLGKLVLESPLTVESVTHARIGSKRIIIVILFYLSEPLRDFICKSFCSFISFLIKSF